MIKKRARDRSPAPELGYQDDLALTAFKSVRSRAASSLAGSRLGGGSLRFWTHGAADRSVALDVPCSELAQPETKRPIRVIDPAHLIAWILIDAPHRTDNSRIHSRKIGRILGSGPSALLEAPPTLGAAGGYARVMSRVSAFATPSRYQ